MRRSERYHPAAKVDTGGRAQLQRARPKPCRYRDVGWSCGCPGCDERIARAQLDEVTRQVAAKLRGRSAAGNITREERR